MPEPVNDQERLEVGRVVRREILGDAHVDHSDAGRTPFRDEFLDLVQRVAWGDVWNRPALTRRERSMITLGILTALRAEGELELHTRVGVRNGLTRDEIKEVLLHAVLYAGIPAANSAFPVAERVLDDIDAHGGSPD